MEKKWQAIAMGSIALAAIMGNSVSWAASVQAGKSPLYESECALGTEKKNLQTFHALLHYPVEHGLQVPGMIIGIEKSGTDQVVKANRQQPVLDSPLEINDAPETRKWIQNLLTGQRKAMFISHVVGYAPEREPTFIFDAYRQPNSDGNWLPPINADIEAAPWLDCKRDKVKPFDAYRNSWNAIAGIRKELASALKRKSNGYTHIVVVTMGWNTVQTEALQNFNSIALNLQRAAQRSSSEYRPYFIGITWPSQWDSDLLPPLFPHAISLTNKANDADEVAAGWLGAAMQYSILPEAKRVEVPVEVIGHSFGARAVSHAVCRGTVLTPPTDFKPNEPLTPISVSSPSVEWLISLQGAYSLGRFTAQGAGVNVSLNYGDQCPAAKSLLFTASAHDKAATTAAYIGPPWAGSLATFKKVQSAAGKLASNGPKFKLLTANDAGCLSGLNDDNSSDNARRFNYVDASSLIFFNAFGTGGGAHSDIYRPQMGQFLWNVISNTATEKQPDCNSVK